MLVASQIDPGHVGPYHRQAFHLSFAVLLAAFLTSFLHLAILPSERNRPGRQNLDSDLGECSASLANVQSPSRNHADYGACAPLIKGS